MTLRETAAALGVRVKTVRNLLSQARLELDAPRYIRTPEGVRLRVLDPADVALVKARLELWRARRRAGPPELAASFPAPLVPSDRT